jgi:hypothetical protein
MADCLRLGAEEFKACSHRYFVANTLRVKPPRQCTATRIRILCVYCLAIQLAI